MDLDISHQTGLSGRLGFLLISWTSKHGSQKHFNSADLPRSYWLMASIEQLAFYLKD